MQHGPLGLCHQLAGHERGALAWQHACPHGDGLNNCFLRVWHCIVGEHAGPSLWWGSSCSCTSKQALQELQPASMCACKSTLIWLQVSDCVAAPLPMHACGGMGGLTRQQVGTCFSTASKHGLKQAMAAFTLRWRLHADSWTHCSGGVMHNNGGLAAVCGSSMHKHGWCAHAPQQEVQKAACARLLAQPVMHWQGFFSDVCAHCRAAGRRML